MKNDAPNFLNYSTVFIPGVNDPVSVGLKVIPSHLTSFDHGGYSADPDFNILLSNYIKYLVKACDFLIAKNVSASLLINDAAPPEPYEGGAPEMFFDKQKRLQSVVSYYRIQAQYAYSQGNTFEGDHFTTLANDYELQLKDIRDYNSNLIMQLQDHERIRLQSDPAHIERKNIYSFIRNDYNTMSLFSKGYGNYEIEQLFNAFGWPEWAQNDDPWARDRDYQAWLNMRGDLLDSRLFYDAMAAFGDPAVRYWSAFNTGNDDFAYAFTRRTHDGVYFRTGYNGNTWITGPDGFRAYQPYGGIMDLSLMDRLAITNPLSTPPAFAMPDLSGIKPVIVPALNHNTLLRGRVIAGGDIPLYYEAKGSVAATIGYYGRYLDKVDNYGKKVYEISYGPVTDWSGVDFFDADGGFTLTHLDGRIERALAGGRFYGQRLRNMSCIFKKRWPYAI